ncbi:MAG: hypothetical protein M3Z00_12055 [Actinomycetota bacterium]|nr:hypothetical protein [Actinomycetota bacterium]
MDRRFLKPGWLVGHLLVLIAVLVCLRLSVWQWHRTHDPDGTVQNLAYAILWPAFAVGFIYIWARFLQLERIRDVDDDRRLDEGLTAILTDGLDPSMVGDAADHPMSPTTEPHPTADTESDDQQEPTNADAVRPEQRPVERPDVFVGTVDDVDDDDDPELAAYNRRLAALAQEDRRRAH